jgi:ABC-2 type transport system permease protein
MYMSVAPTGLIVLGRAFARFLFSVAMVVILGGIIIMLLKMQLTFRIITLIPVALTIVGLYGFGFMIAGIALVFKQVGTLAGLFSNILLFVNGTLLPIDRFPGWLESLVKTLPTTQGIIVLRKTILSDDSLVSLWLDGSLIYLTVHSTIYLIIGWSIFKWCERKAKLQGTLGQY